MACGAGLYLRATIATVVTIVVLLGLAKLDALLERYRQKKTAA